MGLVLWIEIFIKHVLDVFAYMDDNHGGKMKEMYSFTHPINATFLTNRPSSCAYGMT